VTNPVLAIKDLSVSFNTDQGILNVLDNVSLNIHKGETHGLVGESGCGKSVTSMSIMRLLPQPYGMITCGNIIFNGTDLVQLTPQQLQKIRGNKVAMIFQEPMTALNPVKTIGKQIFEIYSLHQPELGVNEQHSEASRLLNRVGIPEANQRLKEYPHQLSGGMRQRVMIAMALACKPDLLIADEPTTALDVTIQAQILDLIKELQQEEGMAVLFITHDLGVIAEVCDNVSVMYAGRIIETANVFRIFDNPQHPYTKGLLSSIPQLHSDKNTRLTTINGQVPSLIDMPAGCRFKNRCRHADSSCENAPNLLEEVEAEHRVNCIHWRKLS